MQAYFEPDSHRRLVRRLIACTHTLYSVAEEIEEVDEISEADIFKDNKIDYCSADQRADLIIAVENLMDVVIFVTEKTRQMAWKHSPAPVPDGSEDDDY